jgi:hypothetical protein
MFLKSESIEIGSASVGVEEDWQLGSQLMLNSQTLSDNGDNEPIANPGSVIRRQ